MFTGIIKAKGTVQAIDHRGGDVRLTVASDDIDWPTFEIGESIAVNGVCLTGIDFHDNAFVADVSVETMNISTLAQLGVGEAVNLEPALRAGDRIGGHFVSGHVDCTGRVTSVWSDARSIRLKISVPPEYSRYLAKKGSVCVDGVSLTVNDVSGYDFDTNIVPHTADATIVSDYVVDTAVNVEVDLVARYLERLVGTDDDNLSLEFLRANGYA